MTEKKYGIPIETIAKEATIAVLHRVVDGKMAMPEAIAKFAIGMTPGWQPIQAPSLEEWKIYLNSKSGR